MKKVGLEERLRRLEERTPQPPCDLCGAGGPSPPVVVAYDGEDWQPTACPECGQLPTVLRVVYDE